MNNHKKIKEEKDHIYQQKLNKCLKVKSEKFDIGLYKMKIEEQKKENYKVELLRKIDLELKKKEKFEEKMHQIEGEENNFISQIKNINNIEEEERKLFLIIVSKLLKHESMK